MKTRWRALVRDLRVRGIDLVTTLEAGMVGLFYTYNVGDFCRLHAACIAQGNGHAGIIVVSRQSFSIGEQVLALLRLVHSREAQDLQNNLVFLRRAG